MNGIGIKCKDEIEVTPEMAQAGTCALFPDGELCETADGLEVMARVFCAMVMGRDTRMPHDLRELLGRRVRPRDRTSPSNRQ